MRQRGIRSIAWSAQALIVCASLAAWGGKPSTAPPPTMIFGSFTSTGGFAYEPMNFQRGTEIYQRPITVSPDGAWFYGDARYASLVEMDCAHHYSGALAPPSATYSPFFTVGMTAQDVCDPFGACPSCRVAFGGVKNGPPATTTNGPAFLPGGTYTVSLSSQNGGGSGDGFLFYLAEANADQLGNLSLYEATANDDASEPTPEDIGSRAYIAASDDRVPLVPQFTQTGSSILPAPPTATFNAVWDTGETVGVEVKTPYPRPGNEILLIPIPRMKTGNHKITVTATLPSGKAYQAPAYTVFVYNVALEMVINGSMIPSPFQFTRTDAVTFRVQQQDTKGKTINVTKADWIFRNTQDGVQVTSVTEPGFPVASTAWTGTMFRSGLLSVGLTIQTGKVLRTSHTALSAVVNATPRTGPTWQTVQNLCQDCWTDLGINAGGNLPVALILPTTQNILDTGNFPTNPGPGVTLGLTGERHVYENGLRDEATPNQIVFLLPPRRAPRPYPLYRPFGPVNDPNEWAGRYSLAQIDSGPNRGYWYVTDQHFHTDWGYAVTAYFNPNSPEGANPANYFTLAPSSSCPPNSSIESCYVATPLSCWSAAHGGQSYFQAASTTIDPTTGAPYLMNLLVTQIQTHEKQRHWQEFLVNYIAQNKTTYDIGTILEQLAAFGGAEADVRNAIDDKILQIDKAYAFDSQGGAAEVYTDPKTTFPIIEDQPLGSANCVLYHP